LLQLVHTPSRGIVIKVVSISRRNFQEPLMAENRRVILSFDDGPDPVSALDRILSVLRERSIKAEFYLIGHEVEQNPEATRSISTQGHKIQNHSWSHPAGPNDNFETLSEGALRKEIESTQRAIEKATGTKPTKIRPPGGYGGWSNKPDPELSRVAESLSLRVSNWDIDTEDWKEPKGIGRRKISNIHKQLEQKKDKTLLNVLLHVSPETARDLPSFISFLRSQGLSFANPTS
jgi:peptidoglycan-N-acetylglucosamine deacetylase